MRYREAADSGRRGEGRLWRSGDVARAITQAAATQHGVVTRQQLLRAGVSEQIIDRRVGTGQLTRLHRGVYAAGPLLSWQGRLLAAVLACGVGALLSHRSASVLWRLQAEGAVGDRIDVTVGRGDRRRPGIRVHRVAGLVPTDVASVEGIPVTSVARTLIDLAAWVPRQDLERSCAAALKLGLVGREELVERIAQTRARGVARLREVLGADGPAFTRSEAESRFVALMRKAQLPRPDMNRIVAGYEVDALWPDQRLVVEIDGFAYHSSRESFEADRRRDAVLAAAGLRVFRVTWRQIVHEPEAVLVRIAQALART